MALLGVAAPLCMGITCTIVGPGGISGDKPLDEVSANINISRLSGAVHATALATIQDSLGRTVNLASDQAVTVNDVELTGPSNGLYSATVDAAADYIVGVREPTRGVEYTTVVPPADFEVTSPVEGGGVSLSGFTVTWSNANNTSQVIIELSQWLGGTREVENFGPYTDTGSRSFDATDLRDFRQGTNLTITITKFNTRSGVAGFATGTLQASVVTERQSQPLP